MTIYATPEQLRVFMFGADSSEQTPVNASLLLRKASGLVSDATKAAVYETTSDGLASDPAVADALRTATLQQAEAWALNGIVPGTLAATKQRVASKSLGGASVSYEANAEAVAAANALASGEELVGDAYRTLRAAGLLSTRVNGGERVGAAYVGSWPLDVPTGREIGPGDVGLP